MDKLIDVVTPLGPNDEVETQRAYTSSNIENFRSHYIITNHGGFPDAVPCDNVLGRSFSIPEDSFPFTLNSLKPWFDSHQRIGWYLQQLLKLYAWKVIPDLSDPYVVVDADTYFLKPIKFTENGRLLFTKATEHHKPYFAHMERLLPGLKRVQKASGVAHHMPLSHEVLSDLFERVEAHHDKPFWRAFMDCVDPEHRDGSGASEYEIVFNFTQMYHPNKFELRELAWRNRKRDKGLDISCDYVSLHWYL